MSNLDERLEQASAEVRRHMQRVPLPPIREQRMRRRRAVAAVALGVAAIAAIATPLVLLGQTWLSGTTGLSSIPLSEPDVILWLSPQAGDEEVQRAASYAMTLEGVSCAAPFGRDLTLEDFREEFAGQPELVLIVEGDPSVLPKSLRLWLEEAADAEAIAEEASVRLAELGTVVAQITVLADMPEEITATTTETETSEAQTTSPTTSEAGEAWISVGEPVSDDEFAALFIDRPVPGTARRLTWTVGYDGQYTLGLFAARMAGEAYEEAGYCLFEYASTSGGGRSEFGGAICARTTERFAQLLAFGVGGGARCVEPVAHQWSVWGVPESADSVIFELSDGTRLTGRNVNGVAQVATGRDVTVDSITFEGATAEQLAEIERFTSTKYLTCAESNDPDLPG